jgi:hypothetical protein
LRTLQKYIFLYITDFQSSGVIFSSILTG